VEPELCTCGLHRLCTHERRWLLSHQQGGGWAASVASAVDDALHRAQLAPGARVLCLGEGSLCALAAASSPHTGVASGELPVTVVSVESTAVAQYQADTLVAAALQASAAERGAAARGAPTAARVRVVVVPPTACLVGSLPAALADGNDNDDVSSDNNNDDGGGGDDDDYNDDDAHEGAAPLPSFAAPLPSFAAVLAEPYFATLVNAPLWTAAHLWHRFVSLAGDPAFARAFAARAVMPLRAALRCQAVAFAQLHATHGPVGTV
jgi:hypothetical protein